ncbi:PREDICTED: uncharacterized protein LOC18597688 [Theobroma cacao]|uniref:Uncharacterized protein LOC18597688 n=1 Tax=Theobroma cacao TaxID=3641 RepID=A0AB32WES8_THECC|nr:PREDICTED: uncharacterized protein LOC18597688 [Theobroma cacao]
MTPLSKKTMQHFTHSHPLTEVYADTEFLCDGCRTLGIGTRYRCESCHFDLHDHCATCPSELSSFMHEHDLKLVVFRPQAACQNGRFCDLCGDPIEGIFYHCKLCEFDVHPLCTQLPEYVRHVMHKDHPLRLQRSVPGWCMVCKDTCPSWHYRCGLCCFDIHFECVLAPCEVAETSTPTPPSLKRPVPPPPSPSASPSFDACYAYGSGAIPPPPYFAYGYGVPLAPPYFGPHPHGYGIPSSSGGYNVNSHPHGNSQGHGVYGAIPPPPYFEYGYGVPLAPPYFGPHPHGYGIPPSSGRYNVNSHPHSDSQGHGGWGKFR